MKLSFQIVVLIIHALTLSAETLSTREEAKEFIRLVEACQSGDFEIVKECLNKGVRVDRQDGYNRTPLMHAAFYGRDEIVEFLLKKGASTDPVNSRTAIGYAFLSGNVETAKILLRHGVLELDAKSASKAISCLLWSDDPRMLDLFIQYGLAVEKFKIGGKNLLTLASFRDAPNIAQRLIQIGLQPDLQVAHRHPLYHATLTRDSRVLNVLLEHGIRPEVGEKRRTFPPNGIVRSPLVNAVKNHDVKAVVALVRNGAVIDQYGNLPIILADMLGNQRIYDLLRSAGAAIPRSHAYLDLLKNKTFHRRDWRNVDQEVPKPPVSIYSMEEVELEPLHKPEPYKLAILSNGTEARDAESLLTAQLSSRPECLLIERTEINQILKESSFQSDSSPHRQQYLEFGQLVGADVLLSLRQEENWMLWKLASAHTGEILDQGMVDVKRSGSDWTENLPKRITYRMSKHSTDLKELHAVSIPILIPEQGSSFTTRLAYQMQQVLAQHLVRHPEVVLLQREELGRLAFEKKLNESTRAFYAAGWQIDGTVSVVHDNVIRMTARISQTSTGIEKTVKTEGPIDDVQTLVKQTVMDLLSVLSHTEYPLALLETEKNRTLEYARRAVNANQWEAAYQNTAVAWSIGAQDVEVKKLFVQTIINRIRESDLTLERWIGSEKEMGGYIDRAETNTLSWLALRSSPLHLDVRDGDVLSGGEYIEMANILLDFYSFTENPGLDPSQFQKTLLSLMPVTLRCVTRPLQYYSSLSDQNVYSSELEYLRNRIWNLIDSVTTISEGQNPYLYMKTVCATLEQLPYLVKDQRELVRITTEMLQQAETFQYPLNKYPLYGTIWYSSDPFTSYAGPWSNEAWKLASSDFMKSELSALRGLGGMLEQTQTRSPARFWELQSFIDQHHAKALLSDVTAINYYWDFTGLQQLPEHVSFKGGYRKYPPPNPTSKYFFPLKKGYFTPRDLRSYYFEVEPILYRWTAPDPGSADPWSNPDHNNNARNNFWIKALQEKWTPVLLQATRDKIRYPVPGLYPEATASVEELRFNLKRLNQAAENAKTVALSHNFSPDETLSVIHYEIRKISSTLLKGTEHWKDQLRLPLKDFIFFKKPPASCAKTPLLAGDLSVSVERARGGYWIRSPGDRSYVKVDSAGNVLYRIHSPKDKQKYSHRILTSLNDGEWGKHLALYMRTNDFQPSFGIADLENGRWRFFSLPEFLNFDTIENLNHLLLEGKLVYAYAANPKDYTRFRLTNIHQTKGDSSRVMGISVLDLSTGKHDNLVINRRQPAVTPLDNYSGKNYDLKRVDGHRFAVGRNVYDLKTNSWSEANRKLKHPFPHRRLNVCGASIGHLHGGDRDSFRFTINRKAAETRPELREEIQMTGHFVENFPLPIECWSQSYEDQSGKLRPRLWSDSEHDIFVLGNNWGFYFFSSENLKTIFRPIIKDLSNHADSLRP